MARTGSARISATMVGSESSKQNENIPVLKGFEGNWLQNGVQCNESARKCIKLVLLHVLKCLFLTSVLRLEMARNRVIKLCRNSVRNQFK